jgi:hypothetical protein
MFFIFAIAIKHSIANTKHDWLLVDDLDRLNFKPITKEQNKLAAILTQAGADLIIGHGAHTIQPIQIINQKPGIKTK